MKKLTSAVALASLGLGAATALAAGPATVATANTSLGAVLVARNGHTLYMFTKDTKTKSNCTGECAMNWIPLTTSGAPKAKGEAKASELGTISRGPSKQVTYGGHPLYEYVVDTAAGQLNGQDVNLDGGRWYAVSPKGASITKGARSSGGGW